MKEQSLDLAKHWAKNTYFDKADRFEIQKLIDSNNTDEITERFYQDLEFGTGGLRSITGMGRNRINKYNVRKAAQAMANCIKAEKVSNPTVCISFDCRHYSIEFAKEICCVFAANSIKAYLFKELTPTPILSYAIRKKGSHAGVMVTASHNPKNYNGLKAYWSDGAQVTPPTDQEVIDAYYKISDWNEIKFTTFAEATSQGLIEYIDDDLFESYYQVLENLSLNLELCQEKGSELKVIFTPLHGTGHIPCKVISERMGFSNFKVLEEQASFDGNFPTVKTTPNPEDPRALEIAVDNMIKNNFDLVYGTDPDGDRLGVAVNDNGKAYFFNGNQIAFLMLYYLCEEHTRQGTMPKNPVVLKSIVTSELQRTICSHYGVEVKNTLTGFKWMAMLWRELQESNSGYDYFFASEESFGYMPHDKVRDKDAVSAIALMNEIALFYKLQGKSLLHVLDEIYKRFGFAQESLIAKTYEGLKGKTKIDNIMEYFRKNHTQVADEKVLIFDDYLSLKSTNLKTGESTPIAMHKSNVIGLVFESGNRLFLRPSGTEPKIKFYTMVQEKSGSLTEKKAHALNRIQAVENYINNTIEPL